MTLEKIRQKVQDLHAEDAPATAGNLVVPFVVAAFCGFGVKQFHHPALRSAFAFAIAWSLTGLYFLNRGMWSATLPGDAALSTGLESYRGEVERRRALSRRHAGGGSGRFFSPWAHLALAKIRGQKYSPNAMPFVTLVVIWIGAYFVIRMREQRHRNARWN